MEQAKLLNQRVLLLYRAIGDPREAVRDKAILSKRSSPMLASKFVLVLIAFAGAFAHANPTTFPVELQLPVVTLVSASGEEKKLEISVAGELTLEGGKATLKNVRLHSPSQTEVSFAAPVLRAMRTLLMEVSSFEVAVALKKRLTVFPTNLFGSSKNNSLCGKFRCSSIRPRILL
jgi:hypothetical protein